jgi:hypothetical protein
MAHDKGINDIFLRINGVHSYPKASFSTISSDPAVALQLLYQLDHSSYAPLWSDLKRSFVSCEEYDEYDEDDE